MAEIRFDSGMRHPLSKRIGLMYRIRCLLMCLVVASCGGKLDRREEFGTLKVGENIPTFVAMSTGGKKIGPGTPSGSFYLHFVSDEIAVPCLDLECGEIIKTVMEKGGTFMAVETASWLKHSGLKSFRRTPGS